jgi:hypothetical protein
VYQVKTAFVPATPFAVIVVVALRQIGDAVAVALVIAAFELEATTTLASTAGPQSPVTLA